MWANTRLIHFQWMLCVQSLKTQFDFSIWLVKTFPTLFSPALIILMRYRCWWWHNQNYRICGFQQQIHWAHSHLIWKPNSCAIEQKRFASVTQFWKLLAFTSLCVCVFGISTNAVIALVVLWHCVMSVFVCGFCNVKLNIMVKIVDGIWKIGSTFWGIVSLLFEWKTFPFV